MTVLLIIIAVLFPWLAILLAGHIVQGILALLIWLIFLLFSVVFSFIPIIGWILSFIFWLFLFIWAVQVVVHRTEEKTNTSDPV